MSTESEISSGVAVQALYQPDHWNESHAPGMRFFPLTEEALCLAVSTFMRIFSVSCVFLCECAQLHTKTKAQLINVGAFPSTVIPHTYSHKFLPCCSYEILFHVLP